MLPAAPAGDRGRGELVHRSGGHPMTDPVWDDVPLAPGAPPTADEHHVPPPPRPATRKKLPLWNRIRLLLLFVVAFFVIVWAAVADNPLLNFADSLRIQLIESQWLIWLAALEVLRQLHYLVSERSVGYNRFWTEKVF